MKAQELARFMNHLVTVIVSPERTKALKLDGPLLVGKVTDVSKEGIVVSAKSVVIILMAEDIEDIRIRRGRVVTRMVREFSPRDDVRQHLADRHAVFMIVLRSITSGAAHLYHSKIDHSDLGHKHGDKPGTQVVDENEAFRAMEELDEVSE